MAGTVDRPNKVASSFRDPSGFLFKRGGVLYRQINQRYAPEYDLLLVSGLYDHLVKKGYLIPHAETAEPPEEPETAYKVIAPEVVRFVSYPYEWSFSQLKDAALATLFIQKQALKYGMSLKDASAYNIQFHEGRPVLIDTLSFEAYREGEPWVAYKQFCQHFLAPLALMAKRDVRLGQLLKLYIDGIPLDLAAELLPFSTRLNFGLLSHIHLHAKAQARYSDSHSKNPSRSGSINKQSLLALLDNLKSVIQGLKWEPAGTEWGDYYNITNYTDASFEHKKVIISAWLERIAPASVWDMGANTGYFTRLASGRGIPSVSFDIDPAAVEKNYRQLRSEKDKNILPLVQDLTNPSPSLGWNHEERDSLGKRVSADMVFALALIHHLAISNNVPVPRLAEFFSGLGRWLVIEFVPKSDSQVEKLLATREDIFNQYNLEDFERFFGARFAVREKVKLNESERYLYLMERL